MAAYNWHSLVFPRRGFRFDEVSQIGHYVSACACVYFKPRAPKLKRVVRD